MDVEQWQSLERSCCMDEPCDALAAQVRRTSKGRPWHGLTVWHQVGPSGDLYVAPARSHSILIRRGPPAHLVQRQGHVTKVRDWLPGEAVIVPAGTPTFWRSNVERDNVHVDLSPLWMERASGHDQQVSLRSCFGASDPVLAHLALALLASLDSNGSLQPQFGDGMAACIAIHLLEHHVNPSTLAAKAKPTLLAQRDLRHLTDLLDANLHDAWPIDRLAAAVGLSPFHFARCFKLTFGQTPHAFVTRRRMERAFPLVASTRRPIGDIALDLGYSSAAHFAQSFRKFWGRSPSECRRRGS